MLFECDVISHHTTSGNILKYLTFSEAQVGRARVTNCQKGEGEFHPINDVGEKVMTKKTSQKDELLTRLNSFISQKDELLTRLTSVGPSYCYEQILI